MNILITILEVLAGIIVLLILIAAVSSKKMNVERSITINKPKQVVFDYVRFVKNHDNFSVWARMDPEMKREYRGTDGQVGFVLAWDSAKNKNVGAGEQEIAVINSGESIEHTLCFTRPMHGVAKAKFIFESVSPTQTKLTWGFYSPMKFPMNVMKPIFKGVLGKNLDTGLQTLKNVL